MSLTKPKVVATAVGLLVGVGLLVWATTPAALLPRSSGRVESGAEAPPRDKETPPTLPPPREDVPNSPAAVASAAPDEEETPTQREDVEAWVARGDASKLTALLAIDVSKDLDAAPAVIMGIAQFSKGASPELKKKAASQLGQMLASERTRAESRDMRGAAGNVATGIDALGEMASPEASAELARALDTENYALHHETRMVQELTKQKYAPARAAVERFAKRTKARTYEDSFDKELQKEALEAADEALTSLSK